MQICKDSGHPTFDLGTKPSIDFKPTGIIHVVLNVKGTPKLEFGTQRTPTKDGDADIITYAKSLPVGIIARPDTPFDVILDDTNDKDIKQQWILIQLGGTADWFFTPQSLGVTSKEDLGGAFFGTSWLDGNKNIRTGPIDDKYERCKFMWFGLVEMAPYSEKSFNYHITLAQTDPVTGEQKRMPVIFDPDVRNPGGKIPP